MQKAISELVVVVLILMIGVALVGLAFVFLIQMNEQTTSEIGLSNTQSVKRIGSCLQIVSFDKGTSNLQVKNCGRYPVENITVFIDGSPSLALSTAINPNEIRNITISASVGIHEAKIVGDYVSAATTINVT